MLEFGLQTFLSVIAPLLHFISVCITITIAFYLLKRFPSAASNYVGIGAFLVSLSFIFFYFMQYFSIWKVGMEGIANFYQINGIIGTFGQLLFLIGLYTLFQQLYRQNKASE